METEKWRQRSGDREVETEVEKRSGDREVEKAKWRDRCREKVSIAINCGKH